MVKSKEGKIPFRWKNVLILLENSPLKVLEKVNDDAYKLELLGDVVVSSTFNMGDLTPYLKEDDDLRANPN